MSVYKSLVRKKIETNMTIEHIIPEIFVIIIALVLVVCWIYAVLAIINFVRIYTFEWVRNLNSNVHVTHNLRNQIR